MAISFEMTVQTTVEPRENAVDGSSGQNSATKRFWDELSVQVATQALQPPKTIDSWQPPKLQAKAAKNFKKVTFGISQTLSFTGVRPSPQPSVSDIKSVMTLVAKPVTSIAFIETAATTTMTSAVSTTGMTRTIITASTTRAEQQFLSTAPSETEPFNLCMALKKACGASKRPMCYGHLVDHTCSAKRHFQVCSLGTSSHSSDGWSIVTLEDVLQRKKGLRPLISLAEKVQLALTIASSVLQLSKTPWLCEGLTHDNAFFSGAAMRLYRTITPF